MLCVAKALVTNKYSASIIVVKSLLFASERWLLAVGDGNAYTRCI